jgi:hypothetical protein
VKRCGIARHPYKHSGSRRREFEQWRGAVIAVFGEAQETRFDEVVRDALNRLP